MDKILNFLSKLVRNNDREWFEQHRDEYQAALNEYNALAERLIEKIALFDRSISGVEVKQSTYRIYRDVRFSHNKDPYKTHMGIYICRGGKKSNNAGYYIHIEPKIEGILNGSFISAGLFMPTDNALKSVRDEIFESGESIVKAIEKAKGFELEQDNKLKRLPRGYPAGSPYEELLKHRNLFVTQPIDNASILKSDFDDVVAAEFSKCIDLINMLNRSIELANQQA